MEEKTFFEYDDVKVTNARFISGGQTYAMSNLTSVKTFEEKPKRFWGILIFLFGLMALNSSTVVGIAICAAAAFYLYKQKTVFHIMLATSSGETSALKTYQPEYLNKVVGALNNAIIHRG
jgi:hypothetical protein